MDDSKVVVLMSGGLDSAVLVAAMLKEGLEVLPITINYGQRHRRELDAAWALAEHYRLPFRVVHLETLAGLFPSSSQTNPNLEVPEGHYEDASMKITVVPNRNMILFSVAIGYAIYHNAARVAYAAHAGDHAIYPDCRPEFFDALNRAALYCHYERVELVAPFINSTKSDIVALGTILGVPLHLTWSCYKGADFNTHLHCGKCGTCVERREAFERAGVKDPTSYLPR